MLFWMLDFRTFFTFWWITIGTMKARDWVYG